MIVYIIVYQIKPFKAETVFKLNLKKLYNNI